MRVLILLALLGAALGVSLPEPSSSRIVGGEPTTIEQYPYSSNMQFLFLGIFWTQFCGGSLVTTRTVLSAAHCFFVRNNPATWRVRLGSSFSSSGGAVHQAARFVLHESYDHPTLVNDVAIVWLGTPAVLSPSVALARIAGPNYNLPDGTLVTAIGWGSQDAEISSPAEQLQRVDVNIINQQLCAARYAFLKTQPGFQNWPDITDSMLCAGILDVGGRDACQGDSGGPLVHQRDIVVGVTSWGYSCAHHFYPGVNARVSYLSGWIVANGST